MRVFPFFVVFFFPYANDNRCTRFPVATAAIVLLNVLAFVGEMWLRALGHAPAVEALVFRPGESGWPTLVTSTFLHAGPFHLAFNLWLFWLIGGQVEERMGAWLFALFYLGGGVFSSFGHWLYCRLTGQAVGLLGASGCIYAVLGAYFILYPFEDFRFWYFILLRWGTIKIAAFFFVLYKVFGDAVTAWWQVAAAQAANVVVSNVGHWAHLGGLAFGLAVAAGVYGFGAFTGKPSPSREERALRRRMERRARRKWYASDGPLVGEMTEEELRLATSDIGPAEGIRRGLFFHNGRMLEWAYQEMLFENPKACLEPETQWKTVEMLKVHGRDALAQVAAWNLLEGHPDSPQAVQARFELGRALARLPEMRKEAMRLLREFLAVGPAPRDRFEAERLLERLEERPLYQWKKKE
jgi:membrane associated rhomboid family serine protease